ALLGAASLVVYLQRRSAAQQRLQTRTVLQQVCERTAVVLGAHVRRLFDGAVVEIIEGIGHPEITEDQFPRLASFFSAGQKRFPYVKSFFVWSGRIREQFHDQVLFYEASATNQTATPIVGPDGQALGALVPYPELGREILKITQELARQHKSFGVSEHLLQ